MLSTDRPQILGRDTQTLRLTDREVSRRHAGFFVRNHHWYVQDLGSSHGTFVDGRRVDKPVGLRSGTQIQVGRSLLIFERVTEVAESAGDDPQPVVVAINSVDAPSDATGHCYLDMPDEHEACAHSNTAEAQVSVAELCEQVGPDVPAIAEQMADSSDAAANEDEEDTTYCGDGDDRDAQAPAVGVELRSAQDQGDQAVELPTVGVSDAVEDPACENGAQRDGDVQDESVDLIPVVRVGESEEHDRAVHREDNGQKEKAMDTLTPGGLAEDELIPVVLDTLASDEKAVEPADSGAGKTSRLFVERAPLTAHMLLTADQELTTAYDKRTPTGRDQSAMPLGQADGASSDRSHQAMPAVPDPLIDVTSTGRRAGFNLPLAVTPGVWDQVVQPDGVARDGGETDETRLWEVVWMCRCAVQFEQRDDPGKVTFRLFLSRGGRHNLVTLKAICGVVQTDDRRQSMVVIMLPEED